MYEWRSLCFLWTLSCTTVRWIDAASMVLLDAWNLKLEFNISKHESKNNEQNKHLSCETRGRRWRNKQYQSNGFQSFLLDLEIEAGHVPSNTSSPSCAYNMCCQQCAIDITWYCRFAVPDISGHDCANRGFPQGFKLYFSGMIPTNDQHFCSYHTTSSIMVHLRAIKWTGEFHPTILFFFFDHFAIISIF